MASGAVARVCGQGIRVCFDVQTTYEDTCSVKRRTTCCPSKPRLSEGIAQMVH
jgi:hypothetical protein